MKETSELASSVFRGVGSLIGLPAVKNFIASDTFMVSCDGELPVSYLSETFKENFLGVTRKITPAAVVRQRRLLWYFFDGHILAALGDKDPAKIERARVALAHVPVFLKTADRTEQFLFYVQNAEEIALAVIVDWLKNGWRFEAYLVASVEKPSARGEGIRVVSP